MDVRVIALHVSCDACGVVARIKPDCDVYAVWAQDHYAPVLDQAEVLIDGHLVTRTIHPA